MPLLTLPNELILKTASYLSPGPLSHLILANRFLSALLTPLLHKLAHAPVNNEPTLVWASSYGDVPLVTFLLKSPTIETNTPPNPRALHAAAGNGHASIVTLLLESGADINALDGSGFTPLLHAVTGGHEDIEQMLVERGAYMRLRGERYVRVIASGARILVCIGCSCES